MNRLLGAAKKEEAPPPPPPKKEEPQPIELPKKVVVPLSEQQAKVNPPSFSFKTKYDNFQRL